MLESNLDVPTVLIIMNKIKCGDTQKPIIKEQLLRIPFQGRESVASTIYAHVKKRFLRREGRMKDDTIIAQVAGCPGMGKTRINVETENMIRAENKKDNTEEGKKLGEYLSNSVFISFSYNNETIVTDADLDPKTSTHLFWIRTLFFYLNPLMTLDEFSSLFFVGILTASVAIEAIATRAKVKWVHIAPDEYNQIVDTNNGHEKLKDLINTVKAAMGSAKVDGQTVFVTCMFTGTIRAEGSFGECDRIECPLLSADSIYQILRELPLDAPHLKKDILFSQPVLRTCILIGTVPRALELLLYEVLPIVESINTVQLVSDSVERIVNRYTLQRLSVNLRTPQNVLYVVAHSILRLPVDIGMKVGDKHLMDLESAGFLMLQRAVRGSYYIELPYVWLCVMADIMKRANTVGSASLNRMLQDMVNLESSPYRVAEPWQHYEVLCVQFRYIVLQLLGALNMPLTVENVWRGAKIMIPPQQVLESHIDLLLLPYLQLTHPYPFTAPITLPQSFIARNAKLAKALDAIIKLRNTVYGEQYRHTDHDYSNIIPLSEIEKNMEDIKSCFQKFKEMNVIYKGTVLISNHCAGITVPKCQELSIYGIIALVDYETMSSHFGEAIATFLDSLGLCFCSVC
jgi:hypothetical protein